MKVSQLHKYTSTIENGKTVAERTTALLEVVDVKTDENMDKIIAKMEMGFNALNAKFEAIDAKFQVIDQKFELVDERFEAMDIKFDSLEKRYTHMTWIIGLIVVIVGILIAAATYLRPVVVS